MFKILGLLIDGLSWKWVVRVENWLFRLGIPVIELVRFIVFCAFVSSVIFFTIGLMFVLLLLLYILQGFQGKFF